MVTCRPRRKRLAQRRHFGEEHRLAAGDDRVRAGKRRQFDDPGQDLGEREFFALRAPRGIGRVAEAAAEVAAAESHKNAVDAGQSAFALKRSKYSRQSA